MAHLYFSKLSYEVYQMFQVKTRNGKGYTTWGRLTYGTVSFSLPNIMDYLII